jgi:hypothetical protein
MLRIGLLENESEQEWRVCWDDPVLCVPTEDGVVRLADTVRS